MYQKINGCQRLYLLGPSILNYFSNKIRNNEQTIKKRARLRYDTNGTNLIWSINMAKSTTGPARYRIMRPDTTNIEFANKKRMNFYQIFTEWIISRHWHMWHIHTTYTHACDTRANSMWVSQKYEQNGSCVTAVCVCVRWWNEHIFRLQMRPGHTQTSSGALGGYRTDGSAVGINLKYIYEYVRECVRARGRKLMTIFREWKCSHLP